MSENIELYPRLVVKGADAALDFYARAFDGEVTDRHTDQHGRVVHAMVRAGGTKFAVKDADGTDPAPVRGEVPVIFAVYVEDADAMAARMIDAGAEVVSPVSTHDYGDRGGRLRDPYGHLWMVAQRL
jgi:uncharacterized glyoxalase superfamily protein PhnB